MPRSADEYMVEITPDKPKSGAWHCGPNPSWVTVTHLPTMISARAYHSMQHKARDMALTCVDMMIEESGETACSFPEIMEQETK